MSGMESFEALVTILGDSKATAAKLAQLKEATAQANAATAEAVAEQRRAEKALDDLAEADRKSEA